MGELTEGIPSGEGPMWNMPEAQVDWGDQTKGPCDLHEITGCVICHPKPDSVKATRPVPVAGARPKFRTEGDPPIIPAAFDSICPSCEEDIFEGDLITVAYGQWVHKGCE